MNGINSFIETEIVRMDKKENTNYMFSTKYFKMKTQVG